MKRAGKVMATMALGIAALTAGGSSALAQFASDSETLMTAIGDLDSDKVIDLVTRKGASIVNLRGYSGETPLTLAMRKRAILFVNYLLQHGADPNVGDKNGDTPLIIAARFGFGDGVTSMLSSHAAVDATNRQGETALIVAVQGRYAPLVKVLLESGANPAKTDNASGLSARDYALRDRRSADIVRLLEQTKKKPVFVAGPIIR